MNRIKELNKNVMTKYELDEYIQRELIITHYEQKIKSFNEAKEILESELQNGLIEKKDFELLLNAEKTKREMAMDSFFKNPAVTGPSRKESLLSTQ